MTLSPLVSLAALLLKDKNFIGAGLVENFAIHGGGTDERRTDFGGLTVFADHQHLIELNLGAGIAQKLLDNDDVAGRNPILLTAGFYDCEHFPGLFCFSVHNDRPPMQGPVRRRGTYLYMDTVSMA